MIHLHASLPPELRDKVLRVLRLCDDAKVAPCDHASLEEPGQHIIWGMRQGPFVQADMRGPNRWFAELAWLTQADGFYLDKFGTNYNGSIPRERNMSSVPAGDTIPEDFCRDLHARFDATEIADDYVLLPLQMEIDTQTEYYGCSFGITRQRQKHIIADVCKAFPHERIVIRPHPREPQRAHKLIAATPEARSHKGLTVSTDGNSLQACAKAKYVVGTNSTVLIEALTFGKKVCALGMGVFSGCHSWTSRTERTPRGAQQAPIQQFMLIEGKGDARKIAELRTFTPDADTIRRFLYRLIRRQIPFDIPADAAAEHPQLKYLGGV